MKTFIPFALLICAALTVHPQDQSYIIPLKAKYASDFEFITNTRDKACLYLDQNDYYFIALLDTNYQVLAEFRDKFYTISNPRFIGSTAKDDHFELFFRRVEDDILLVLSIDCNERKISRTKDFKITDQAKESVIYTGSTYDGNKMITISKTPDALILKKHLPGLVIEKYSVPLHEKDADFIAKATYRQFKATGDSLIIIFKQTMTKSKGPVYKFFNINLDSGSYNSFDFACDRKKRHDKFNLYFYGKWILHENCDDSIRLYDRLSGELIKKFKIDFDRVISNENIPVFKYSFNTDFGGTSNTGQYAYLKGKMRRFLRFSDTYSTFYKDSSGFYLKNSISYISNSYARSWAYVRFLLPFDKEMYEINYDAQNISTRPDTYDIYYIDRQAQLQPKVSGWFHGFGDDYFYGYLQKKTGAFVIEKVDF